MHVHVHTREGVDAKGNPEKLKEKPKKKNILTRARAENFNLKIFFNSKNKKMANSTNNLKDK